MPLLSPEPFLYPENLFEDVSEEGPWWVLHTRPRAEKALARKFLGSRRDFFLPLAKKEWRNRGRLFSSHVPLFPGYLFLRGDAEARQHALETNQVARVLPVLDPARLRADLARVYHVMLANLVMTPEDRLQPGTPIVVVAGPLKGLEGTVLRRGKELRFFIEVQLLQRGVSVEIESWMIRPLDRTAPMAQRG